MKFVAAQPGSGGKARYRCQQFGMAIAQIHPALGMAGDKAKQASHPVQAT